jgi:NAD(P)-dependent dehydrogenase (short-subunit alcohol dehydrogenase family)
MLDGKTVIVTGAASGVGRATVPYLAESNANVIAFDINDPAEAVEAAAGKGGTARAFTGDVRSPESWSDVVRLAVAEFGTVHGLANVAAFFDVDGDDRLVSVTDDVWNRSIDVNLRGPYLGMKAVLPLMLEQGHGSIVNVSSSAARRGIGNLASYSASKGGLEALTRQAATEYGPGGVRANVIALGPIATPLLRSVGEMNGIPLRRIGEPLDVAAGIEFLLSDRSAYISGVTLPVDGGLTAAHASLISPPPGT